MSVGSTIRAFLAGLNVKHLLVEPHLFSSAAAPAVHSLRRCGFNLEPLSAAAASAANFRRGHDKRNGAGIAALVTTRSNVHCADLPRIVLGASSTSPHDVAADSSNRDRNHLQLPTVDSLAAFSELALEHAHPLTPDTYGFGPISISARQVLFASAQCLVITNIRPVVPGHVLVLPRRRTARLADLDSEELAEMWAVARDVAVGLEAHLGTTAITFCIQDGVAAGQTVPHVHIHILPRREGDFLNNDDIYPAVDRCSASVVRDSGGGSSSGEGALLRAIAPDPVAPHSGSGRGSSDGGSVAGGSVAGGSDSTPPWLKPLRTIDEMEAEARVYVGLLAVAQAKYTPHTGEGGDAAGSINNSVGSSGSGGSARFVDPFFAE